MTNSELDEAVAKARGWNDLTLVATGGYSPSTKIVQAWQLVEEMRASNVMLTLEVYEAEFGVQAIFDDMSSDEPDRAVATADTAPRAICLAYLKAKGIEVEGKHV